MSHSIHYNAAGIEIPSVTQVPGIYAKDMSGFQDWICKGLGPHTCCTKAAKAYYSEAADLGHDIHELREAFLNGKPFSDGVPEYQAKVFEPIANFYKSNGYKPLFVEKKITTEIFGGSLDGCGSFSVPFWDEQRRTFWDKRTPEHERPKPGDLWIDDLKIKSKIDILHPLQLYGYRELLKAEDVVADWGLIIRREKKLDKRPEIQLKAYYLPAYKTEWDASLLMWNFLNR